MPVPGPSILIAGVGNVLRGDDGFGIELANRLLATSDLPPSAKVIETGIGGMTLVQEVMLGYDLLILLDAYRNNGKPGELHLLQPVVSDLSDLSVHELRDYFSDTHYATPMRALNLLAQMRKLPETIYILGCEPESLDGLRIGLSPAVAASVDKAVRMALRCVERHLSSKFAE